MLTLLRVDKIFSFVHFFLDIENAFSVGKNVVLTDEMLVKKIQKGEKQLFEDLVGRYSQKIFRYLYYYFSFEKDIAEDVVQDVFCKLWEKIGKFDVNERFESWFYRFVHNYTIDWIRKNQKEQNVKAFSQMMNKNDEESGNNFEDIFVLDSVDIRDDANKAIKSEIIKNIITKVGPGYKEVVLLYYFEQKSYEEIAKILGKSVNNIGILLLRAKQKIKEIVDCQPDLKDVLNFDL